MEKALALNSIYSIKITDYVYVDIENMKIDASPLSEECRSKHLLPSNQLATLCDSFKPVSSHPASAGLLTVSKADAPPPAILPFIT